MYPNFEEKYIANKIETNLHDTIPDFIEKRKENKLGIKKSEILSNRDACRDTFEKYIRDVCASCLYNIIMTLHRARSKSADARLALERRHRK